MADAPRITVPGKGVQLKPNDVVYERHADRWHRVSEVSEAPHLRGHTVLILSTDLGSLVVEPSQPLLMAATAPASVGKLTGDEHLAITWASPKTVTRAQDTVLYSGIGNVGDFFFKLDLYRGGEDKTLRLGFVTPCCHVKLRYSNNRDLCSSCLRYDPAFNLGMVEDYPFYASKRQGEPSPWVTDSTMRGFLFGYARAYCIEPLLEEMLISYTGDALRQLMVYDRPETVTQLSLASAGV